MKILARLEPMWLECRMSSTEVGVVEDTAATLQSWANQTDQTPVS